MRPVLQQLAEGVQLTLATVGEDGAQRRAAVAGVVDQQPGRRARGDGERLQPVGEAVLEGMVRAGVEESLFDLRLYVSTHQGIISRNEHYVYRCRTAGDQSRRQR